MGIPERQNFIQKRSCTDILFLVFFIVNAIGVFAISIVGFMNGDISLYFKPSNSQGELCGHDSQVASQNFLYYFDITKCIAGITNVFSVSNCPTKSVCIDKCPEVNKILDSNDGKFCLPGTATQDITTTSGKCPTYLLKTKPILNRCFPDIESIANFPNNLGVNADDINGLEKFTDYFFNFAKIGDTILRNLYAFRLWTLLYVAASIIICLIVIYISSFLSMPLLIFVLIAGYGFYGAGLYLTVSEYIKAKNDSYSPPAKFVENMNFSAQTSRNFYLGIIIALTIGLIIHLILTCLMGSSLRFVCECLQKTSKILLKCPSIIVLPILCNLFQLAMIVWIVGSSFYLWSVNEKEFKILDSNSSFGVTCDSKTYNPVCIFFGYKNENNFKLYLIYIAFGAIWFYFFIQGCMKFTISYCYAIFYWMSNKEISNIPFMVALKSISILIKYHIGSIALGSFLIAILYFIQIMLDYLKRNQASDKPLLKFFISCLQCILGCCQKIIEVLTENAYIEIAISGNNFCVSAKKALSVVIDMPAKFASLLFTIKIIVFMNIIFVSGAIAIITHYHSKYLPQIDTPMVILVSNFIIALIISSIMLEVYSFGSRTLFFCVGEDLKLNDGTPEKPYKIWKGMKKILNIHEEEPIKNTQKA